MINSKLVMVVLLASSSLTSQAKSSSQNSLFQYQHSYNGSVLLQEAGAIKEISCTPPKDNMTQLSQSPERMTDITLKTGKNAFINFCYEGMKSGKQYSYRVSQEEDSVQHYQVIPGSEISITNSYRNIGATSINYLLRDKDVAVEFDCHVNNKSFLECTEKRTPKNNFNLLAR